MKYVLDSNVALKWALPESDSGRAVRLRDEYRNGIHELVAPDIFPSEIANGLASAERQKRIQTGESTIFLNDILSAAPARRLRGGLFVHRFSGGAAMMFQSEACCGKVHESPDVDPRRFGSAWNG
jgi:hypothetical protein